MVKKDQLVAVMMMGIPDWDLGGRAEELCAKHDIQLEFVNADEVNQLLGRKTTSDWVTSFEKAFPEAGLEVLGTLAIRVALEHAAKTKFDSQTIAIGLNLEDLSPI